MITKSDLDSFREAAEKTIADSLKTFIAPVVDEFGLPLASGKDLDRLAKQYGMERYSSFVHNESDDKLRKRMAWEQGWTKDGNFAPVVDATEFIKALEAL